MSFGIGPMFTGYCGCKPIIISIFYSFSCIYFHISIYIKWEFEPLSWRKGLLASLCLKYNSNEKKTPRRQSGSSLFSFGRLALYMKSLLVNFMSHSCHRVPGASGMDVNLFSLLFVWLNFFLLTFLTCFSLLLFLFFSHSLSFLLSSTGTSVYFSSLLSYFIYIFLW